MWINRPKNRILDFENKNHSDYIQSQLHIKKLEHRLIIMNLSSYDLLILSVFQFEFLGHREWAQWGFQG